MTVSQLKKALDELKPPDSMHVAISFDCRNAMEEAEDCNIEFGTYDPGGQGQCVQALMFYINGLKP